MSYHSHKRDPGDDGDLEGLAREPHFRSQDFVSTVVGICILFSCSKVVVSHSESFLFLVFRLL